MKYILYAKIGILRITRDVNLCSFEADFRGVVAENLMKKKLYDDDDYEEGKEDVQRENQSMVYFNVSCILFFNVFCTN